MPERIVVKNDDWICPSCGGERGACLRSIGAAWEVTLPIPCTRPDDCGNIIRLEAQSMAREYFDFSKPKKRWSVLKVLLEVCFLIYCLGFGVTLAINIGGPPTPALALVRAVGWPIWIGGGLKWIEAPTYSSDSDED